MTRKQFREKLTGIITRNMKIGKKIILGNQTYTCIGTEDSNYGIRFVFDNGTVWTVSNIVSNIIKYHEEGKGWDFI